MALKYTTQRDRTENKILDWTVRNTDLLEGNGDSCERVSLLIKLFSAAESWHIAFHSYTLFVHFVYNSM